MHRNYKTLFILGFLFMILLPLSAQHLSIEQNRHGIILGYWGPILGHWSPEDEALGIKAGYSHCFLQTSKYKVNGEVSFFLLNTPTRYCSPGLLLSSTLQRTFSFGLYLEQSLHLGYKGSIYYFDLYSTDDNGHIVNLNNRWNHSMILGFSVGLGYDFSYYTPIDLKIYCRPTIYYQSPNHDNLMILYNYSFDIGFVYSPDFLNS